MYSQSGLAGQAYSSAEEREYAEHYADKTNVVETVQSVPTYLEDDGPTPTPTASWQPGWLSRFPWLGLGSLFVVVLCSAAAIVVLAVSDKQSQNQWPKRIQPSIILSGLNSIANICFSIAIANGVAIAWWRKALKGATIENLHKSWSFSSSVKEAVLAGRAFNVIALAALTAKFTIIDGMLMQSASTTYVGQDSPVNRMVFGYANQSFVTTGTVNTGSEDAKNIDYDIFRDMLTWDQNIGQLPLTSFRNCEGRCFFKVPAMGFMFECSSSAASLKLNGDYSSSVTDHITISNGTALNKTQSSENQTLLNVAFSPAYTWTALDFLVEGPDSNLTMDLTYVQATSSGSSDYNSCSGTVNKQSCLMRPAIIKYPVMVQNYSLGTTKMQGIRIGVTEDSYTRPDPVTEFNPTLQQQEGFEFVQYHHIKEVASGLDSAQESSLAGLNMAFNMYLGGSATIQWQGAPGGWRIEQHGNAQQYVGSNPGACSAWYNSPTNPSRQRSLHVQSVVASINQMMFAIATNVTRNSTATPLPGEEIYSSVMYRDAVHYQTRWAYAAGAIASTLFCIICILPVFWGYWQLGRKVTLGPFEIAHAFRSPMTAQASTGNIEEVIREVGKQKVQYGQIVAGDARGVLGVAEPEYVAALSVPAGRVLKGKMSHVFGREKTG